MAEEQPRAPRVSLGMPVYNAQRYLRSSLDSVLAQDFTDFELIISDNGSIDDTWAICNEYAARDPRIRLYRNDTNIGIAGNFNLLVERARGELFRWVAYDDLIAPTLLSACVRELDRSGPRTVLAFPQADLIDDDGVLIKHYEDRLDLRHRYAVARVVAAERRRNLLHPIYGVMRLDQLRRTGLLRPYLTGDLPLLIELAALGEFHEVPEVLFFRRFHVGSSDTRPAAWWTPHRVGEERFAKLRRTVRIMRVLAGSDLPTTTRTTLVASYAGAWSYRECRGQLARRSARLRARLKRQHSLDDVPRA